MVIKKGKHNISTGSSIKSTYRLYNGSLDPRQNATLAAGGDLSFLDLAESFEPGHDYSLNKRKRWLIPNHFKQEVRKLARTKSVPKDLQRKYLVQEHDCHSGFRRGRCHTTDYTSDMLYYNSKIEGRILERHSSSGMLNAWNAMRQWDAGKFYNSKGSEATEPADSLENEDPDCAYLAVYHGKRPLLTKHFSTSFGSSKVMKAIRRWKMAELDALRRREYPELRHEDIKDSDSGDEAEEEVKADVTSSSPPQRTCTIGDLLQMASKQNDHSKKASKKRSSRTGSESVNNERKAKIVYMESGTGPWKQEKMGPFSIYLSLESVQESCSQLGSKVYASTMDDGAWSIIFDYRFDDIACNIYVLTSPKRVAFTGSVSLHDIYNTPEDVANDLRKSMMICGVPASTVDSKSANNDLLYHPIDMVITSTSTTNPEKAFACSECSWDLIQDEANSDIMSSGLALKACHHIVCSHSIKAVVSDAMAYSRSKISCPEAGCQTELGDVLVALFCGAETLEKLNDMRSKVNSKCWSCGFAMKAESVSFYTKALPIACPSCKKRQCFQCGEEPHWPISCDEYREVQSKKKTSAAFQGYTAVAKGCCDVCIYKVVKTKPSKGLVRPGLYEIPCKATNYSSDLCWFCGTNNGELPDSRAHGGIESRPVKGFAAIRADWIYQMEKRLVPKIASYDFSESSAQETKIASIGSSASVSSAKNFANGIATAFADYQRIAFFASVDAEKKYDTKVKAINRCVRDFCKLVLDQPLETKAQPAKIIEDLIVINEDCLQNVLAIGRLAHGK